VLPAIYGASSVGATRGWLGGSRPAWPLLRSGSGLCRSWPV